MPAGLASAPFLIKEGAFHFGALPAPGLWLNAVFNVDDTLPL
jgi:hypothetical protein